MKRIFGAVAVAMALAPLGVLAQSKESPQENICLRDCQVEYDHAAQACGNQAACLQTAGGAFKTCLATCPANK